MFRIDFPRNGIGRSIHGICSWEPASTTQTFQGAWYAFEIMHMVSTSPVKMPKLINRHLYENGNFTTSLRLLDIAYLACADKTSELYADLQFKAGSIYMDQNDLINCRLTFEDARILYENAAAAGSADADHSLTWLLHSLGNLEVAQGNLDLGLDLYAQADQKRKLETTQNPWREALTRMTAGRAHFLKGEYDIALSMYNVAASIFEMNSLWMAL